MWSKDVEEIVSLLSEGDERLARRQALMARLRVAWAVAALVVFLGVDAWLAGQLWSAWHTGVWGDFWPALRNAWLAFPLIGLGSGAAREAGRQVERARVLRRVIAARVTHGGEEARQPEPLAGRDLPVDPERIGPFERLERDRSLDMVIALVISTTVTAGFVFALAVLVFLAHVPLFPDLLIFGLIFGIPAAIFVCLTLLAARRLRRVRRPFTVVADESGVEWQGALRRRPVRMAWREPRTFFAIAEPGDEGEKPYSSVYILAAERRRLAWSLPRDASAQATESSERIASLIGARAGLPLMVVSAAALSPEDYDSRASVPEIEMPMGRRTARLLQLAWRVPLALTGVVTLLGLILPHVRPI